MKVTNYQIHDIVSFRVVENNPLLGEVSSHIKTEYEDFLALEAKPPDFVVHFGKFTPQSYGCYVLDEKYYVRENYLYCQDYHKYAGWEMEVTGLEEDHQEVRISSNIRGSSLIPELLVSSLIWFALNRKGYSLVHASCVGKDSKAYLFSGFGGAGKTIIALSLVEKGFDFMGDHFVILGNGVALSFPSAMHIFDFNLLPSVRNRMRGMDRISLRLKNLIHRVSRIRLVTKISPAEIFSDSRVDRAEPVSVFLLNPGSELVSRKINKEHLIRCITAQQKLECLPFSKYWLEYAYMFPRSQVARCWHRYQENLDKALADTIPLFELEVPTKYSETTLNDICQMIR